MSLERLFKLIRREDIAIWIGAGFSMYAGFPSGMQLQQKLINELSDVEQAELGTSPSLRATASAVEMFRGSRNELNRILRSEFSRKPVDTHLHDLLSRVPHFKHIVTTNYDPLVEDSFTHRAIVVRNGKEVPNIENGRPVIYKPHGDIYNQDNIVITENDYTKFFNIDRTNPLLTAILHILTTKSILFLGYGLEDENDWSWLDLIEEHTGNNRKERFLIAPKWQQLKQTKLAHRHVTYLDLTADEFLNQLHQTLKENLVSDLENKIVSQDTFNKYIEFHELNSLILSEDGNPKLASLFRKDGSNKHLLNFTVADKKIISKIDKLNRGFGKQVVIKAGDLLNFEFFVEGFKMNFGTTTMSEFVIASLPNKHTCTLEFPEQDFVVEKLEFEVTRITLKRIKLEATLHTFKIVVIIDFLKGDGMLMNLHVESPTTLPPIINAIKVFEALHLYYSGNKTIAYLGNQKHVITARNISNKPHWFINGLDFFKNLRTIERALDVIFEGVKCDFSAENLETAAHIAKIVREKSYQLDWKGPLAIPKEVAQKIEHAAKNISIIISVGSSTVSQLMGVEIDFGAVAVQFVNPVVTQDTKSPDVSYIRSKNRKHLAFYDRLTPFKDFKTL